jgi:hypothetical protein
MEGSGLASGSHRREQSSTEVTGLGDASGAGADGSSKFRNATLVLVVAGSDGRVFEKVSGGSFILRN